MSNFTLDGATYDYLRPGPGPRENIKSWEYGKYPKIMATLPLAAGATVDVYAHASRWNPTHILVVAWQDDGHHPHWAWVSAGNVRRVTDSEWDIEEYRRCHGKPPRRPLGRAPSRVSAMRGRIPSPSSRRKQNSPAPI